MQPSNAEDDAEFEAFRPALVVSGLQKRLASLALAAGRAYVGLNDGGLLVLAPVPSSGTADPAKPAWEAVNVHRAFGKKHVSQVAMARQGKLLLSLSDEGVNLHTLPALKLTCQANRSKAATRFAWDEQRAMLAVAVKRKLMLYHYDSKEFVELKELSLPDTPLCMQWCGEHVVAGFKKEYSALNANTGVLSELLAAGTTGAPCMCHVAPAELMLAQDNLSLFAGPDGKLSKRESITWSDSPVQLGCCAPYAVALLPKYIEVRSIQRLSQHGLAQRLPIAGMSLVSVLPALSLSSAQGEPGAAQAQSAGGSMLLGSPAHGEVQQLVAVPFAEQARVLAQVEEFAEGLALAALVPPDEGGERTQLEDMLHTSYAHHLFARGEYEEAMAQVGMCSYSNPIVLLRLFPSLASREMLEPVAHQVPAWKLPIVEEPQGGSFTKAVGVLLPYLLSHRSRIASFRQIQPDEEAPGRHESRSSLPEWQTEANGQGEPDPGSPLKGRGFDELAGMRPEQRQRLAVLVDTAIVKVMLELKDTGALLSFVKRPNRIDLREAETALRSKGRFSELVALYQRKGQHEVALDFLYRLSQAPDKLPVPPQGAAAELAGLTGVWAAVRYLVEAGGRHPSLVKKHSRWILKADPEAGLEMFTQMNPPLAPATVLPILTAQAPLLCAPYLESAIHAGTATAEDYHNDLAQIYLQLALEQERTLQRQQSGLLVSTSGAGDSAAGSTGKEERPAAIDGSRSPLYIDAHASLKQLLLSSSHIDSNRLLNVLPAKSLPEIRALLLEQLGRHKDALRIYLHQLREPRLAEAYCDRVYEATQRARTPFKSTGTLKGGHALGSAGPSTAGSRRGTRSLPADTLADDGLGPPLKTHRAPSSTVDASWTSIADGGNDMYLLLIQVYLEQGAAGQSAGPQLGAGAAGEPAQAGVPLSTWEEVARLLGRKHDRIDPMQGLPLLPGEVSLKAVLPFLEGAVRGAGEQARNALVIRSLRRSEHIQLQEQLARLRQRSIVVTAERACGICHKRISTSVFVGYPDGSLVHYSCFKREGNQDPALGVGLNMTRPRLTQESMHDFSELL